MLKQLFDKSKIWFAVAWIIAYCVLMSAGDSFSDMLGVQKSVTFVIGVVLCAALLGFLKKYGLLKEYGICRNETSAKAMLYYLPVAVMLTANCWHGLTVNYSVAETILYILSMLCVGFLEEVIFRGLLFNAMKKDSLNAAIIVSSLTFGIGHIINLINGSGAELLPNLLQVVYATSAGFMFVMMYCKTKSLVGCIVIHGVFNALSAFSNTAGETVASQVLDCILLIVITGGYAWYLAASMKDELFCKKYE